MNQAVTDGAILFAEDTGKMWMDAHEQRIPLGGGGASLIYGHDANPQEVADADGNFSYVYDLDQLDEPDKKVFANDLILNSDGSFFRVTEVYDEERQAICTRLAVSGSGGGGGGGGSQARAATIKGSTLVTSTIVNGQNIAATFTATSALDQDGEAMDEEMTISWRIELDETKITYAQGSFIVPSGKPYTFEFGNQLRNSASSTLYITAAGVNSGSTRTINFKVTTVELTLMPSEKFTNASAFGSSFTMYCNISGAIDKILKWSIDGEVKSRQVLGKGAAGEQKCEVSGITHGYHTVTIDLLQSINGEEGVGVKEPLQFEIAVSDGVSMDPIIWLGNYGSLYYNYDSVKIPFKVYNPKTATTTVQFFKGITELDSSPREVSNTSKDFEILELTDTEVGMLNTYTITCKNTDTGVSISRDVKFEVIQDPNRDMTLVSKENLLISFDAAGRSNNESATKRATWTYGDKKATFKDFNWYNNGWMLDENKDTMLRISNGAEFSIPIGSMIINDATTVANQSRTFELEFKVRNVQDYSNLVKEITRYSGDDRYWDAYLAQSNFTNYDDYLQNFVATEEGYTYDFNGSPLNPDHKTYDELTASFSHVYKQTNTSAAFCSYYDSGNHGFCLGPQDGFFSSGSSTVNVKYVEDKLINLTIVFNYTDKRIYMYLNGVLTSVTNIRDTQAVTINTQNLKFNSEYCDVDLYKFRVYNGALSIRDILMNYAVDHKSVRDYDHTRFLLVSNTDIGEYQIDPAAAMNYTSDAYANDPNEYLMPYVIFETNTGDALPFSKAQAKTIAFTFVNTPLERAYATGELEELANAMGPAQKEAAAAEGLTNVQYYYKHHCPSFTSIYGNDNNAKFNVKLSVQGTSSEFYPRRNYKAKTKGSRTVGTEKEDVINMIMNKGPFLEMYNEDPESTRLDFFYMNNYVVGTTKFTMKIDYMESSGTYNMGLGNLVNNAYSRHPLDDLNAAGAFLKISGYEPATTFDKNRTYYEDNKGKVKVKPADQAALDALIAEKGAIYTETYQPYQFDNTDSYRTNIQGFPVMTFWKDANGKYTYIGRYNMLLDKGSDECYGFKPNKKIVAAFDKKKKAVSKVVECWEYSDNNRGYCSFRDPLGRHKLNFDYYTVDPLTGKHKTVSAENATEEQITAGLVGKIDRGLNSLSSCPIVADSYEYRYNPDGDLLDYFYDPVKNGDLYSSLIEDGYEASQLQDIDWKSETLFDKMKNWEAACQWVWSTCTDSVPSQGDATTASEFDLETGLVIEGTNSYINGLRKARLIADYVPATEYDANIQYYDVNEDEIQTPTPEVFAASLVDGASENYFVAVPKTVTYGTTTYTWDSKEYRRAKFTAELGSHFNLDYCLIYFVVTEVLMCYDSRGKNCMMATWGPQTANGDYIWYPIFYDMDTQLGINNTGIPSFDYFVNATKEDCFSTSDSVLWNNLFACFFDNIKSTYQTLKGQIQRGNITKKGPFYDIDTIEGWYRANPDVSGEIEMRGSRPLAIINMDEFYKYISITNPKVQYQSRDGSLATDGGTYFYALQGDRSLSRQQFLARRINFIDSWLGLGDYSRAEGTSIRGRMSANSYPDNNSDKWVTGTAGSNTNLIPDTPYFLDGITTYKTGRKKKTNYLDADTFIGLTPYQNSYVTLGTDNEAFPSRAFNGQVVDYPFSTTIINGMLTSPNYAEQLVYIFGGKSLKDIGDISRLYYAEFYAPGATHLSRILLGCDDPEFFNKNLKYPDFDADIERGVGKPLLKEVNLTNCTIKDSNSVNFVFTSSEKLEIFKALGSNIDGVTFAKGVALNTLYLPNTIKSVELVEAANLTNVLTTKEPSIWMETYDANASDNPSWAADAIALNFHGDMDSWIARPGLYIEGLTNLIGSDSINANTNTNIESFSIVGGNLGYDTYKMINVLYQIKKARNWDSDLKINLENVQWSPYLIVDEEEVRDSNTQYFVDDFHYGFKPYVYTNDEDWALALKNKEIYKLDTEVAAAQALTITDVQMFRDFITQVIFKNTTSTGSSTPNITGEIYVNNETAINESDIRNILMNDSTGFPKLHFHFAHVNEGYHARFISMEDDGTYKTLGVQVIGVNEASTKNTFSNPFALYEGKRDNYDFKGWNIVNREDETLVSLSSETSDGSNEWNNSTISHLVSGQFEYTYYVIFVKHKFKIEFKTGTESTGFTEVQTDYIPYGDKLITPAIVPIIDESSLGDEERYRFIGWTQDKKAVVAANRSVAKTVNLDFVYSTSDMTFYACFIKESVYDSVTDLKYFSWKVASVVIDPFLPTSEQQSVSGYSLSLGTDENGNAYNLSGKITLPLEINGTPIVRIECYNLSGFGKDVTHIYFQQDVTSKLLSLDRYCFARMSKLKVCELPDSITQIGEYVFFEDSSLKPMNFNWDNLLSIGTFALSNCFNSEITNKTLYFGGNIKFMAERAVSNILNSPKEIVVGDNNHPCQLLVGGNAGKVIMRFANVYPSTITFKTSASDYTALRNMIETSGPNGGKCIQISGITDASTLINIVFEQV